MVTYETAEDRYISVNGHSTAYRLLGKRHGVPLLHIAHCRGTMDHMDPLVANGLAAHRPLILYDAPGVGRSTGSTSTSFAHAATDLAAFITALDLPCVDIWGFSMGGCVAQMLALNHPHLVRKLILSGSIPSIGPGIAPPPAVPFAAIRRAQSLDEHKIAFIKFSFNDSETSQAAGVAGWERVINARQHRCWNVGVQTTRCQITCFAKFMDPRLEGEGSFHRLGELELPVLMMKGSNDVVVPDSTFEAMVQAISRAPVKWHVFPDSGHAVHFQYPKEFVSMVNAFLDDGLGVRRSIGGGIKVKL